MTHKAQVLKPGEDILTSLELIKRAAASKGLRLDKGATKPCSEPIATYELSAGLLAALDLQKIRQEARPDCRDQIFTLVDENPQEHVPGWAPSNYWNFKMAQDRPDAFDLRIKLCVEFMIDTRRRGVVLFPRAHGTFVSPVDRLPNYRMFKALVNWHVQSGTPSVAHEIARMEHGEVVIPWIDFSLGGVRKMSELFDEFSSGNEAVRRLAYSREVFEPSPYVDERGQLTEESFVTESAQPRLFKTWRDQLEEYRRALVV